MEKCEVICIKYEKSDTIEIQGKKEEIEKYKRQGYYVKEERNGYWILEKPAKVNVSLKNDSGSYTFNMKDTINEFYGAGRISEKLVKRFDQDIKTGKIGIYMDNNGEAIIKK